MTDADPNRTRPQPSAAAAATAAEPRGPVIPWGRHSWLWLSLIGAGIAILFFTAGFAASSVITFATHSMHGIFQQGGVPSGDRPGFDHRGFGDQDGDGFRPFHDRDGSSDGDTPSS